MTARKFFAARDGWTLAAVGGHWTRGKYSISTYRMAGGNKRGVVTLPTQADAENYLRALPGCAGRVGKTEGGSWAVYWRRVHDSGYALYRHGAGEVGRYPTFEAAAKEAK